MAVSTTTHERLRATSIDTQSPSVINVRRPNIVRAETPGVGVRPRPELRELDDAPLPQTVLRLPDLAAAMKRFSERKLSAGSVAQWVGIGLGGLLALWLIFGGRRAPAPQAVEAPAWTPPASAQVETAPRAWNVPAASPTSTAHPSVQADVAPVSPEANPDGQQPSDNDPIPPEFPEWDDSANREAPAGTPSQDPGLRTARRADVAGETPSGPQSSEVQPLGITVPVQP